MERGLSPATQKVYRAELISLQGATENPLEELHTEQLREWVWAKGGAPSTVARRIAALRSFYGFLVRSEKRLDDPTARLDRPKVPPRYPRPVEDVDQKLRRLEYRWRLAAVFLLETGLRIAEAYSVELPQPAPDTLVVTGKGSRTRKVPLTDLARAALDRLGGRMPGAPRTMEEKFRRVGFTPHQLRHTLATQLSEAGEDISVVQELLGHASPATTRIYYPVSQARIRRGLERRGR